MDQSDATLDQMLELMSLGSSLASSNVGSCASGVGSIGSVGSIGLGASGSLIASMRGLRSWDPWTNRQGQAGRQGRRQTQRPEAPESPAQLCRTTRKAAGSLYDSMVRAERLASARAAHRIAVQALNTNNNTNELDGGLKDIQRHGASGLRTTVITRLAAGASVDGGGVLDVNFVMDSNSSNTTDTTNQRGVTTTDDSNDTNDWRWMHDADKATPAKVQQRSLTDLQGQQRGSKESMKQGRASKDSIKQGRASKDSMNQGRASKESIKQGRASNDSIKQGRASKESMNQRRASKDSMNQHKESTGPPSQQGAPGSASQQQQQVRRNSANQSEPDEAQRTGRESKGSTNDHRLSNESLFEHPISDESRNLLAKDQQGELNGKQSDQHTGSMGSLDQPSLQDSTASGNPPQSQQPRERESQTPRELPPQQTDEDTAGEGEEGDESEGDSEGRELEDEEEAPQQAEEKQNVMSARKKLSVSHLQKEGVIIGCMNVFADVMKKEFVVLLTDSVVRGFLVEPSQFRAIATRTGCEIEVTRRILNRRIGGHRWVKYLVITIKGPTMTAIDQCDRLMVKLFPPYKCRKEYLDTAAVALFVKESYPDNTNLYFNFQRTGPTRDRLGELRLQTPFEPNCPGRPLENTPWKYADWRLYKGLLEPRNLAAENVIQHIYPEWGSEVSNYIDKTQKWELAGDAAIEIEKTKNLERSLRVKHRKMDAEPLFAENT